MATLTPSRPPRPHWAWNNGHMPNLLLYSRWKLRPNRRCSHGWLAHLCHGWSWVRGEEATETISCHAVQQWLMNRNGRPFFIFNDGVEGKRRKRSHNYIFTLPSSCVRSRFPGLRRVRQQSEEPISQFMALITKIRDIEELTVLAHKKTRQYPQILTFCLHFPSLPLRRQTPLVIVLGRPRSIPHNYPKPPKTLTYTH